MRLWKSWISDAGISAAMQMLPSVAEAATDHIINLFVVAALTTHNVRVHVKLLRGSRWIKATAICL
jgi:hypothetical protein